MCSVLDSGHWPLMKERRSIYSIFLASIDSRETPSPWECLSHRSYLLSVHVYSKRKLTTREDGRDLLTFPSFHSMTTHIQAEAEAQAIPNIYLLLYVRYNVHASFSSFKLHFTPVPNQC